MNRNILIPILLLPLHGHGKDMSGYSCVSLLEIENQRTKYYISLNFESNKNGSINIKEIFQKGSQNSTLTFTYEMFSGNGVIKIEKQEVTDCKSYSNYPMAAFNNCRKGKESYKLGFQKIANSLRLTSEYGTFAICPPLP
ncbi:hypothetical protein [Enterobacter huaxiensis]|uniref:hypothetical protein n=1 Tax=Enterobacter huaxiensis TaxID=2494702 RepID=UPI00105860AF|nr:hypothetical protein [Enterobacter huaxiensis]UNC52647.1 hypothetical protein D5067_0023980 [Enterobacter huaxiensis]